MYGSNIGDVKVLKEYSGENTDLKFYDVAMEKYQHMRILFSSWVLTKKDENKENEGGKFRSDISIWEISQLLLCCML